MYIGQKRDLDTYDQSIYSYVKYYEKDSERHEIYFPIKQGRFKGANAHSENSDTTCFDENKKITTKH